MTDKALLIVIKDKQDKRKRLIQLITSGQALKEAVADIPKQLYCKFDKIDHPKIQPLMLLLNVVIKELDTSM